MIINDITGRPFSTSWIRATHVCAGTHKGKTVFRFDGDLTDYEPGKDALEALLALQLPESADEKPPTSVISFLEQCGPLGLYFRDMHPDWAWDEERGIVVSDREQQKVRLADYWMRYHTRKRKASSRRFDIPTRAEIYSHGYFEQWSDVHTVLSALQNTVKRLALYANNEYPNEILLATINDYLMFGTLKPALRENNGRLEWSFAFLTLMDALVNLIVQKVVGGAIFATCQPCGRPFTTTPTGRKYCSDECMIQAQEIKRRNSALLKEKRRLRELLRTRVEQHGLPAAKAEKVRLAVNAAPDTAALDTVKEQYQDVFARHTRNV